MFLVHSRPLNSVGAGFSLVRRADEVSARRQEQADVPNNWVPARELLQSIKLTWVPLVSFFCAFKVLCVCICVSACVCVRMFPHVCGKTPDYSRWPFAHRSR